MISKEKLKEYAKIKNYNLEQAEKDYFQEIILFILYREFGNELVFKGGTAITKCYGFDRFSEDLDFTLTNENKKNYEKIINNGLKKFYIEFDSQTEQNKNPLKIIYKIKGPLYINQSNSACKIVLDISLREKIQTSPKVKKIGLNIEEIPSFEVVVMSEQEIFAEKIRAIITRNNARDLYDLYYLIKKGTKINTNLIKEKTEYYSEKFSIKKLKEAINSKEKIWEKELKHLVKTYPKFKEAKKEVLKQFNQKSI